MSTPPAALAVAGALLAGGPLLVPILAVLGFSSVGPIAGSLAAAVQSAGAAGAFFSTLQSAAMGGSGLAVVTPLLTGLGAVVGAVAGAAGVAGAWLVRWLGGCF